MKKLVAMALVLCLMVSLLAGCGTTGSTTTNTNTNTETKKTTSEKTTGTAEQNTPPVTAPDATPVTDWITYSTDEMQTFNYLESNASRELIILANCIDGLLTNNSYGELIPSLAESYETNDGGKTWTFHLRDGATWVNNKGEYQADVVAEDWLWSMEWVMNFWKNAGNNTTLLSATVEGASEYYAYTKELDEETAKKLDLTTFLEMVKVEAPDDHTLVYHCKEAVPYFPTMTTSQGMFPVSGKLLEQLGSAAAFTGVSYEQLWYNGPYMIDSYVQGNEKMIVQNPSWWNTEDYRFNSVTWKMVSSTDVAYQMYQTGELDHVDLSESTIKVIKDSSANEFHDYLVGKKSFNASGCMHLCWAKNNLDDTRDADFRTAVGNEAFRKSLYYGLDFTDYLSRINSVDPIGAAYYTVTIPNLSVGSDGVDYSEMVRERLDFDTEGGDGRFARYDAERAAEYKKQAIEELTAQGVSFPINFAYYIQASNQNQLDDANVLKKIFDDCLGKEYVDFEIRTFISSFSKEARLFGYHSINIKANGPGMGDPIDYLNEASSDMTAAHYSYDYGMLQNCDTQEVWDVYGEYTAMIREAEKITDDLDARYAAMADAEAFLLNSAMIIPIYTNYYVQLTHANDYSKIHCAYGIQSYRFLNWETDMDGYTTEEYAELETAFNEAKAAYFG